MSQVNLKGAGNYYLCAEGGGGGAVNVNRPVAAQWETWDMAPLGTLPVLADGQPVQLRAYDGHDVLITDASLGAKSGTPPAWLFSMSNWIVHRLGGPGEVKNGDSIALESAATHHYLCAEHGGNGPATANRTAIGAWETFQVALTHTWPMRASRYDTVATGHMQTDVTLSPQGQANMIVQTVCDSWTVGFTGGVTVLFADAVGNVLDQWHDQYGVDAKSVFFSNSARTEHRTYQLSANAQNVEEIVILQFHDPHNRLDAIFAEVESIVGTVEHFLDDLCQKYQICWK
jgi:hypothetical protein